MGIRQKLHLVVYRVRERGLEIFVHDNLEDDTYELPETDADRRSSLDQDDVIALEPVEGAATEARGYAIEGDYHDIPSLKGLLLEDARRLRDSILEVPQHQEGTFVGLKVAAKRLLPEQYRMLSELRDILVDRNSTKYM